MDKAQLLKRRLPQGTVEIPDVGTVTVRGLSRAEALEVRPLKGAELERRVLSLGLVDPAMTEDEVGEWLAATTADEIEPVSEKIAELSGMLEDSAKAAYKSADVDAGA